MYSEILKLHEMLEKSGIPHEIIDLYDGWQIICPSKDNMAADAIEHYASYGGSYNLIEIMGLLTDEEKQYDSAVGYLTAEEAFERFEADFKKRFKSRQAERR